MTEVPNFQILDAKETLEALLSQKKDAPVKLAYAAKKTHGKINEEAEELEEFRMDLLKDFAETDEEGNVKQQTNEEGEPTGQAEFESEEAMRDFQERLSEIYSDTVNIDAHTVDVNGVGEYRAPASWAKNLDFMIEGFDVETVELQGGQVQASVDSVETILGLKAEDTEEPVLPLKFSAGLFKTYNSLAEAQAEIEESRLELLEEYAEKDGDSIATTDGGTRAKFPNDDAEEEFQEELNEVYNQDFEVDAHLVEIDYTDGVNVHPRHTIILDWMLTD